MLYSQQTKCEAVTVRSGAMEIAKTLLSELFSVVGVLENEK